MEKQLKILMDFYRCSFDDLAKRIGISSRQLYNVKNGKLTGRFLKEKILNMVEMVERMK